MLRKMWLAALLLGVSAGTVAADCCPTKCCPNKNQWRVTADYLYFMPSVDDTYFVIDSPSSALTFPNGDRKNNDLHFHSGYRVGGAYEFCDCDREVEFYYSHLGFNQSRTVTGTSLSATIGRANFLSSFEHYLGSAESELKYLYQRYDAFYSQRLFNCCGLDVDVKLGLEAAELKLNEEYTYIETGADLGIVREHARTWGIGPQFGFAGAYDLYRGSDCSCLPGNWSINFISTGSLLAANTKTSIFSTFNSDTSLDVKDERTWRIVPAFHARVGLGYDLCFSCADVSFEVGYEFTSYFRGLTRVVYPDDTADTQSFNNYYNFDMQGLYVSGSVKF